jgi:hypothetical protein
MRRVHLKTQEYRSIADTPRPSPNAADLISVYKELQEHHWRHRGLYNTYHPAVSTFQPVTKFQQRNVWEQILYLLKLRGFDANPYLHFIFCKFSLREKNIYPNMLTSTALLDEYQKVQHNLLDSVTIRWQREEDWYRIECNKMWQSRDCYSSWNRTQIRQFILLRKDTTLSDLFIFTQALLTDLAELTRDTQRAALLQFRLYPMQYKQLIKNDKVIDYLSKKIGERISG